MNRRLLGKEKSLNDPIKDENGTEWQDWIIDDNLDQEVKLSQAQEFNERKKLMNDSMSILNAREKEILIARRLSDKTCTLEYLSKKYKISRERIRQIETKAFEKLQKSMINASKSKNLLPANQTLKGSSIKIVSSLSGLVEILETFAPIKSSKAYI